MASVPFDHILLQGSAGFIARTQAALECLRTANCHTEVWGLLAVVREAKRSAVHVWGVPPVIDVGERVWNSPTIWYASGIAHEGFHTKLYRETKLQNGGREPETDTYLGTEAEKKCLEFQLRVLEELNAEGRFLEYLREMMTSPTYQGNPFSFDDYLRRDW